MSLLRGLSRSIEFFRAYGPLLVGLAQAGADRQVDYSDWLDGPIGARGERPALIGESGSLSWSALDATANRVAHWAESEGLRRGDVVALLMENRPEFVAIWLGLSRIGVVTALLNTNLTGDRLAHCLHEASARHLVVGTELAASAASAMPELEEPPQVLLANGQGSAADRATSADLDASRSELPSARSFDEALAAQPATPVDPASRAERRGADGLFLIYASGTTGLPKAARVSHSKALAAGLAAWKLQGLTEKDRVYCCLPLYHSAGGMMAVGAALLSGGSLVISPRFSAKRFWSDCTQHDVTAIQYIGELCRYLLNSPPHPDERNHKIRVALGNGLRPEVWTPFQKRFGIPRIVEFYGATEGNLPLFNIEGRVGAVGHLPEPIRRLLGVEIARFDVELEEVLRGEDGFCVRAPVGEPGEMLIKITKLTRFEGYTNDSASSKKVLHDVFTKGDAYFRTGDLLRMDDEGFFYFVDRIGDTFRWKGENVATSEVAEVLSVVDGVHEANVYGVAVEGTDGRAGMAALVTDEAFDLEALGRVIESELAFYARPVFIRLLPQMEITGTFKHRKVDLVEQGFDPGRVADPLYFRDPEDGRYVPLDAESCERILRGEIRL